MKGAYVIQLAPYEISNFTFNVSNKWDCVKLLIVCVRFYLTHSNSRLIKVSSDNKEIIYDSHIKLEITPAPRLYIYVGTNKYISIVFPFNIKLERDNIVLWYNSIRINEKIISEILTLINMRGKANSAIGSSLNTLIELYMSNDEYDPISDEAFYVIENLLLSETGYIRHDYDPQHSNGKIHPEYHFDINFSKQATFKYGSDRMMSNVEFELTFDKSKDCFYLRK